MSNYPIQLYNTRSRKLEPFAPINPPNVGLYTCGPTVYGYAHIGNMRSYIFADTLRRTLDSFGLNVKHVMNITDVGHLTDDGDAGDDKMEVGAARDGLTAWDIAEKYTAAFFDHAEKLNIIRPQIVCKATDHIDDQVDMVKTLESKGYTYQTNDGIYFDTSKFDAYADFAKLDVEGLQSGHRIEAGGKKLKTDFALWKFSPSDHKRQMEWDSPWGRGFPGWHVECSAMASHFLGTHFDIHTGGVDHINIHHTNEVAQSECTFGTSPWVNVWMHGEFLVIDDAAKMSKSVGNVLTVDSLIEMGYDPMAYRLLCLQSHYRKQLSFAEENLRGAGKFYDRLTQQIRLSDPQQWLESPESEGVSKELSPWIDRLMQSMANDLNTPQAIAHLSTLLDEKSLSMEAKGRLAARYEKVLGLNLLREPPQEEAVPKPMQELLDQRNQARASKDWGEADRLRDEILSKGYEILDSPEGSSLKRKPGS